MIKDVNNRLRATRIQNLDKEQPNLTKVSEQIVARQLIRTRKDIADWRDALAVAENVHNPSRTQLIKVFNDVMLDGHINGIITSIKNKIKTKEYFVENANGEIDEERTKQLEAEWYFTFIDFIIESRFWGYSLVQLGDIVDDGFPEMELIPRENVVPELELVKKDAFHRNPENGFKYMEEPMKDWFIFVGTKTSKGLLNLATAHALSKKNLLSEMWEYGELFGIPIRKGKTDLNDKERRKNLEKMLSTMGSSAWAVTDKEDEIEFVESTKGDPTKVFIEPIKLSNDEISKAFAGAAGVFDEKAFVGSAEAQERLFKEYVISFMRQIKFVMNDELFPRMVTHNIMPEGHRFVWKADEILTVKEKAEIIKDLSPFYQFSPETVSKEIGIQVEEMPAPAPIDTNSIMNEVQELYKQFF